jgi:cell division GTPase FtsZ
MGSGIGEGIDRAEDAIQQAIASPLLEDVDVKDAKGLLINITSNGSLTNGEFKAIGDHIGSLVDEEEADVIVGTTIDESLEDKIKVTVVATGMRNSQVEESEPHKVDIVLDNINNNLEEPLFDALGTNNSEEIYVFSKEKQETALVNENEKLYQEEELANYDKQQKYKQNLNLEVTSKDDVKDEKINNDNNIKHKKNSNGELDLDFLDIPAFLRKQAD